MAQDPQGAGSSGEAPTSPVYSPAADIGLHAPSPAPSGASPATPYPGYPYPPSTQYLPPPPPPLYTYTPPAPAQGAMVSASLMPNRRRRPGYLIAAIGAGLALFTFFTLPLFALSFSVNMLGTEPLGFSQSLTASQVANSGGGGDLLPTSLLWIVALAALAPAVLCAVLPLSLAAARNRTHTFGGLALLLGGLGGAAVAGVLNLAILDQLNHSLQGELKPLSIAVPESSFQYSVQLSYGFYFLLATFMIVALGGVVVLLRGDTLSSVPGASDGGPMPRS